jgi:hypothetical protein
MPLWSERAQTKERSYNFTIPWQKWKRFWKQVLICRYLVPHLKTGRRIYAQKNQLNKILQVTVYKFSNFEGLARSIHWADSCSCII